MDVKTSIRMNGRVLLDTNIVIVSFAKDPYIVSLLNNVPEVFIPVITLGELYFGAWKSTKRSLNFITIEEFIRYNTILFCGTETANIYGKIKNELCKKSRPIPDNDIWIAAIAKQHQLMLISRDKHFTEIDELEFALL